jgi:hypothetical protein
MVQVCTIFRGRMDRHFCWFFAITRSKRRSNYVCATPSYVSCIKKLNYAPFSEVARIAISVDFLLLLARNGAPIMFAQRQVMFLALKSSIMRHFPRSHGSSFRWFFCYYSARNGAPISLRNAKLSHKFFLGRRELFPCLQCKINVSSSSKNSNKHHFWGSSSASSFPRLCGHYSGRNGAVNMVVQCLDMLAR